MPIPSTLLNQLVETGPPGLFAIGQPPYAFVEYNGKWFYVRGLTTALEELRQYIGPTNPHFRTISADQIKVHKGDAIRHAMSAWAGLWPSGDWDRVSNPQINRAYRTESMRFDKAWLTVAALATMSESIDPTFDWAKYISICPCVFSVDGFDQSMLSKVESSGHVNKMSNFAYQTQTNFLVEMTNNKAVTYRTASRVKDFLNQSGYQKTEVIIMTDPDGPSSYEEIFYVDIGGNTRPPSRNQRYRLKAPKSVKVPEIVEK